MRKSIIALLALVAMTATAADVIPMDPTVRTGTLDNGLTYYVKHNNYPEHHADFFIAQRVGSIQEEENQRGLAHFLEHMCFNGTKHFPGNSLIDYLERNGVKFGANLNAYTSTDETVYNISNVPTGRQGLLDSCMLVLSDWGHDLLLRGKDIDEERGVIEGEYRYRSGANYRLMEKSSPDVYPDCLYGARMPIGLMSVVKNFKHKELRDYYKKWYHPSNQCIIVVGDIDPDWAVAKIQELFGKVKNPKHAAPVVRVEVPDNEQIISTVQTDPEQTTTSVRLLFKHDDLPSELMPTTAFLRDDYLKHVVAAMMTSRFNDLKQDAEAPFTHVGVTDRNFIISKSRNAFQLIATSKEGQADRTMQWLAREVQRASRFGFTDGELRRARLNYVSALDKLYRERDRYSNTTLARDFVRAYLEGEPLSTIEVYHDLMLKEIDQVTLDEVNRYFNTLVSPTDRNVVLMTYAPEKQGVAIPTRRSLIDSFHEGRSMQVTAWVDSVQYDRLLTVEPLEGSVVKVEPMPVFGAELWTLSNGMRAMVKKTNLKQDEVVIAGAGPGGLSQNYRGAQDGPSFKVFGNVAATLGFGQFSSNDLKKVLAGKNATMRTFVSKTEEGFQGTATRADLETAFQLLYLKLTSPQQDVPAFKAYLENNRSRIANQMADPKFEFADSLFANVFNHHPLGGERLGKDEVDRVDLDRVLEVYRDRFADMSDVTLFIVGDFDTDTLRRLLGRYVASLPASSDGRQERPRDIGYRLFDHHIDTRWTRKMENPQDKVYFFWTAQCDYNMRNALLARVTGQIFSAIFRQHLREDRGWTYHVDTHCSVVPDQNGDDAPVIFMPLNVTVTAGKADETRQIITDDVNDVAVHGVTAEQLDKVVKYLCKVNAEDRQDNTYWMSMMKYYDKFGIDFDTDYVKTLQSFTPDDIRRFVATYIAPATILNLTMTPE
ncbi:MAG: insulinase family protein [Muribaculaceae bacterium]|nr:insulinase family protein [Muribaculaceae bacterium]